MRVMRHGSLLQQRVMIAAALVLVLCAVGVWVLMQPSNTPSPEPADARVMRQI